MIKRENVTGNVVTIKKEKKSKIDPIPERLRQYIDGASPAYDPPDKASTKRKNTNDSETSES